MDENIQAAAQDKKSYPVEGIGQDSCFSKPVYLEDGGFLLAAPGMPLSAGTAAALKEWGFTEVLSAGEPVSISGGGAAASRPGASSPPTRAEADEAALLNRVALTAERLRAAGECYSQLREYAASLYFTGLVEARLSFDSVSEKIRPISAFLREDPYALLVAQWNPALNQGGNYLASHAARSAIFALLIGSRLKVPPHKLFELGAAALLHDIGMLVIPQAVYLSPRALTPEERVQINGHPTVGGKILARFRFPLEVCLVAQQHHEREDGSGYPAHLSGDKISFFSKIVAVAYSYEAAASPRSYRKALDPAASMTRLLQGSGSKYDKAAAAALGSALSIYPVGVRVQLSDGRKGQVVFAIPGRLKYPLVQIEGESTFDGRSKVIVTARETAYITGVSPFPA